MGSCIICGASADGHVCSTHEEDVAFTFTGDRPEQLTPGRFYEGTVDGFADFGVFVTIGGSVTGLLHRSELRTRLENLDWTEGDTVYVKVTDVRENGNVDLSWSIRQSADEFRGKLVDDPEGDRLADDDAEADAGGAAEPDAGESADRTTSANGGDDVDVGRTTAVAEREAAPRAEPTSASIDELDDHVGDRVRIEGRIVGVRQTGGPTIFELRDETGVVDCAAFEEAGVRAYPDVESGDHVRIEGKVERRGGDLQVETDALTTLDEEDAQAVADRLDRALEARARPEAVELFADHPALDDRREELREAAGAIRRAIVETRPIVVRHTATADGYVAGTALERAVLPLIREEHDRSDAEYHYFDRQPLGEDSYDMGAATNDLTRMLTNRERHGEKLPLVVLVGAGGTAESVDGLRLLDVYGVDRLVVDAGGIEPEVEELADTVLSPADVDPSITVTALAANVAIHVNADVREGIAHLPAVSYWDDAPEAYATLAREAGYDEEDVRELREAVALEAYYQSYEDKRELIADLLFEREEDARGLASHVSEQFRIKLADELDTVRSHVERRDVEGTAIAVIDTDAFSHRFEFPSTDLLLDSLHRELREGDGPFATIGVDETVVRIRATEAIDTNAVGDRVRERVDDAGVTVTGRRSGRIEFLAGRRDAVVDAVVDAVAAELAG